MREIAMLRNVKANTNGSRVPFTYLKIDIAHRRVEGAGIRIDQMGQRRHRPNKRSIAASMVCTRSATPRKENHIADTLLKTRSVLRKFEYRPLRTVSNETYARPDIDRSRDPIV